MAGILTLDDVTVSLDGGSTLFSNLSFSLTSGSVGLVGRNGSGKSTLLSLIYQGAAPTSGTILRSPSVGMLNQRWEKTSSVGQALGVSPMLELLKRLESGSGSEVDLAEADWTLTERLQFGLTQVELEGVSMDRPASTLSGGERVRLGVARLLLDRPDLLLFDEPTNDLDRDGRALISRIIQRWHCAVLVASHDRELLERVERIVELSPVGCHIVSGGWTQFETDRTARRERAEAEHARADDGVRATALSVQRQTERKARRDKAGRSYAAKGIEPRMYLHAQAQRAERSGARGASVGHRVLSDAEARAEAAREAVEVVTPLRITLPPTGLSSDRRLLSLDCVTLAFGDGRQLGPLSAIVQGPERIALVGANGSGKSTLLRLANGDLSATQGSVERAEGLVSLLDQHVSLLRDEDSVLENIRAWNADLGREEAHAVAARFAFRADAALKPVGVLSGGERMRAALACVTGGHKPAQLLLLDEPTNHLDIDAIELLEAALRSFDGALMIASHDRSFLDRVGMSRWIDLDDMTRRR